MNKQKIIFLLNKYRRNIISPEEYDEFLSQVNQLSDNDLSEILHSEWDHSVNASSSDLYSNVHHEILMNINKQIGHEVQPKRSMFANSYLLKVAASLVILFFIGLSVNMYIDQQTLNRSLEKAITVNAGKGERATVTLPDGSVVKLNSESQLSYQQNFGLNNRQVFLLGEGYFEVKKNPKKEFIVMTKFVKVRVTGTTFNLLCYDKYNQAEMALVDGSVMISALQSPEKEYKVSPNQKAVFDKKSGTLRIENSINKFETAWVKTELVFHSEPLKNVLLLVGRKYGFSIKFKDYSLMNESYTGCFDSEDIEEVLSILTKHFKFKYLIWKNEIIITNQ